ncbi:MAG TPA: hypothetical protein VIL44_07125 [Micromonospora sp.]
MEVSVRRGVTRLAVAVATLLGFLAVTAAPAQAAEDLVQFDLPASFAVGQAGQPVTVTVTRRADGCVRFRILIAIHLAGLTADRVQVRVADGKKWAPVRVVTSAEGLVMTEHVKPPKDRLCAERSRSAQYQLAFLPGSPGGEATIVVGAYDTKGTLLGQAGATRPVTGAPPVPTASPSPSPSHSPSPTLTPEETETAYAEPSPTLTGSEAPALVPALDQRGTGGISGLVLAGLGLGVALLGVGLALLIALLRRGRDDTDGHDRGPQPHRGPTGPVGPPPMSGPDMTPTVLLPKLPR